MKYRKNNKVSIKFSEIGFGAWGIGGVTHGPTSYGEVQYKTAIDALNSALNHGITYYDTSNVYGAGESEKRIADAFSSVRDDVIIGTKAGLISYDSRPDYKVNSIQSSIHSSLKRLRTDYIDILYLHNVTIDELHEVSELSIFLDKLKLEGKIRSIGLSLPNLNSSKYLIKTFNPDFLQFNFNMMDWRILDDGVFDYCEKRGCSIIARTPLANGFLTSEITTNTNFDNNDHRSRYSKKLIHKLLEFRQELVSALSIESSLIHEYAIRFCLSFSNVVTVIPGILSAQEARTNAAISDLGPLNQKEINSIKQVYDKYSNYISILINSNVKDVKLGNKK